MKIGWGIVGGIVLVVGYFLYKRHKSHKEFEKFARENPNWQRDLENMTQCAPEDMPVDLSGNGWVDLGLPSGLLWDSCNLGASAPEEYGCYYAWGDPQPMDETGIADDRFFASSGSEVKLTKYCNKSEKGLDGFSDKLEVLEPCDDAATADLEGARIPTIDNWIELISNTTGEFTTLGGVRGYRFTAANGNSIFLPAAGHPVPDSVLENARRMSEENVSQNMIDGFAAGMNSAGLTEEQFKERMDQIMEHMRKTSEDMVKNMEKSMPSSCLMGFYWSSTLFMDDPMNAWSFTFDTEELTAKPAGSGRAFGFSIRAVRPVQR